MKKVMTVGMVSVALASVLNAATPAGMQDISGDTAPIWNGTDQFVKLEANKNYTITATNATWSYASRNMHKFGIEGSGSNTVKAGVEFRDPNAVLTINGAFKTQGATVIWNMSQGGRLIINGGNANSQWWDGTALGAHFGVNEITLGNQAILEIKQDLRAIGGGTNNITMDGNSRLIITGKLLADGNGVNTNKITATNSTVEIGGVHGIGKWNGDDAGINEITLNGGKLIINGDVKHGFDNSYSKEISPDHFNKFTLNGGAHEITGNVFTDGWFGGRNIFNLTMGGQLTIGGDVNADLYYAGIQHGDTADGSRSKLITENVFTFTGNNSKLHIKGNLTMKGGDVTKAGNYISMTGAGEIIVDKNITVKLEDGATGRKTVWEGQNLNVIDAPQATLTVGQSVFADGNRFGVVKANNAGNRIDVKNLSIGADLVAREDDQYNTIKINGGKLDIKNEIRAFAKVGNGATGAANYIELASGSEMTVGGLVFADNYVTGANAVNRFKATNSTLTFNGDVKSHQGGKNDLFLTGSSVNLNGAVAQLGEVKMDKDTTVTFKGNMTIENANSTGGTFIAAGKDIRSNILTINNSANMTTYNYLLTDEALLSVNKGDVVARTKNTDFVTGENDDGLLTTKLILKGVVDGQGYTTWFTDGVVPVLSKTAYDANTEVVASTNTLYLANMNSLNKRMGELRNIPNQHGAWGRVFGGEQTNDFSNSKTGFVSVQAGYDYSFYVGKDKNNYVGAAFSYGYGTTDFSGIHRGATTAGVAFDLTNNNMTQHLIEVALYNSYVENEGWYNDTIVKLGALLNKMETQSLSVDNANFVFTLSDEFGYRFKLGEKKNWFIDPQAEVTFGYVAGGEFNRFNRLSNLVIDYDGTAILRERIGASAGYNAINNEKLNLDVYVGLFGEFDQYIGGKMNVATNFAGARAAVENGMKTDMRGVVNYGVNVKMNSGLGIYADVEHSFGGKLSTTYKVNGGVRYSFGDTKLEMIKIEDAKKAEDNKAPIKLKEEEKKEEAKKDTKDVKKAETKKSDSKKVDAKKETKKAESKKADTKKKPATKKADDKKK